jgi:predicted RecB family nuclease
MVETDIIDVDVQVYRPDRVVIDGGKVRVIDYKFGQHHKKYERQMETYSEIFRRMGHADVTAVLWYVQTGEYKVI